MRRERITRTPQKPVGETELYVLDPVGKPGGGALAICELEARLAVGAGPGQEFCGRIVARQDAGFDTAVAAAVASIRADRGATHR